MCASARRPRDSQKGSISDAVSVTHQTHTHGRLMCADPLLWLCIGKGRVRPRYPTMHKRYWQP